MTIDRQAITYEEALLDWAAAECVGPSFSHCYALTKEDQEILSAPDFNPATLNKPGIAELIRRVEVVRQGILSGYGINRNMQFHRCIVSAADVKNYGVIPGFNFLNFGALTDGTISDEKNEMRKGVLEIIDSLKSGRPYRGTPIAVMANGATGPTLIEGYKRSMAVLLTDQPIMPVIMIT